jgi:hypothetical protein
VGEYDPVAMLRALSAHGVAFVTIGGVAARLQGAPILTQDVDITPRSDPPNLAALAAALGDIEARLRTPSEPDGLAFPLDPAFLGKVDSWTLTTRHGDLDIIFQPAGTSGYGDLISDADHLTVAKDPPLSVWVASLVDVVRSKEAAGREKDRAALPLLRRTLEELGKGQLG